jgi:hypothetical protein
MLRSQLFFTATETVIMLILLSQLDIKSELNPRLMAIASMLGVMHAVQVLLDEGFGMGALSLVYLVGDCSVVAADFLEIGWSDRGRWVTTLLGAASCALVFQLVFADKHSFSIFRW